MSSFHPHPAPFDFAGATLRVNGGAVRAERSPTGAKSKYAQDRPSDSAPARLRHAPGHIHRKGDTTPSPPSPIHSNKLSTPSAVKGCGVPRCFLRRSILCRAQSISQPALPYQPIQYLLKEDLSLSAAQAGFVWAMIGLGWTIKPIYGLVSDFLPLGGSRRKGYLVLMSALGLGSWLALAVAPTAYAPVLALLMACSFTLAFADVMADALMVETGRPLGLTGSFQSIQWAAMGLALTLAHLGGGYLSEYATPHTAFFVCGFFPLATLLATLCFVREAPHQSGTGAGAKNGTRA